MVEVGSLSIFNMAKGTYANMINDNITNYGIISYKIKNKILIVGNKSMEL